VLDSEIAADVLNFLPAENRPEIVARIANLDTVPPAAMQELETVLKQQFAASAAGASSSFGGVKAAAKILNFTKTTPLAGIISGVEQSDSELAMKIQDNMLRSTTLPAVIIAASRY